MYLKKKPPRDNDTPAAVRPAALGFRAHSGWAAMVAVGATARRPIVLGRLRIDLADEKLPRPVQPYHAAKHMKLMEGQKYIQKFADDARRMAGLAIRYAIQLLREQHIKVVACGIPTGSGRLAGTLEAILVSHPQLHTAEGELFRNAIVEAGKVCHLPVLAVPERKILERGAEDFNLSLNALDFVLTEIGRPFGPPWGQDQKLAMLAAWLALVANSAADVG